MYNFVNILTNSNLLIIAGTALVVIIIAVLAFLIAKKSGLKFINAAESIASFIKDLLDQLGFDNTKMELIVDLVLQAVSYCLTINGTGDIEGKIKVSMEFLNNMLNQLQAINGTKVELDETEISVLQTVFKLTFIFIDTLGISKNNVAYKKLVKYVR